MLIASLIRPNVEEIIMMIELVKLFIWKYFNFTIDISKPTLPPSCGVLPKARPRQRKVHYVQTTKRSGFGVYIGAQIDLLRQFCKLMAKTAQRIRNSSNVQPNGFSMHSKRQLFDIQLLHDLNLPSKHLHCCLILCIDILYWCFVL